MSIEWQAASAPGANDGVLTLWLDGTQVGTVTTLDNDTRRVNTGQMGPVAGIDTGTRGTGCFEFRLTAQQLHRANGPAERGGSGQERSSCTNPRERHPCGGLPAELAAASGGPASGQPDR